MPVTSSTRPPAVTSRPAGRRRPTPAQKTVTPSTPGGQVEALDRRRRSAARCGVALGRAHHGDRGVVDERRASSPSVAGGRLGQQVGQVAAQPGQHDLGLGIAEAHVVLEHLGPVGREHEPGVEHAPVVDAPAAQRGERGLDGPVHHHGR